MIKSIFKAGLFCLIAVALVSGPAQVRAQETNQPPGEKKSGAPSRKKSGVIPFHGKLKAVDKTAKTISVGETTVQITSETKIMKDGKPATLDDGMIGEAVGGAYKKTAEGKLDATSVRFGAKPEATGTKAKKAKKTE